MVDILKVKNVVERFINICLLNLICAIKYGKK